MADRSVLVGDQSGVPCCGTLRWGLGGGAPFAAVGAGPFGLDSPMGLILGLLLMMSGGDGLMWFTLSLGVVHMGVRPLDRLVGVWLSI